MFAPSGQTMPTANVAANTQVFLWVRNVTKVTNPSSATFPRSLRRADFSSGAEWANGFRRAGEQQIIGIRNGYVGTAPVLWPDDTGAYPAGQNEFSLARSKLD